MQTCNTSRACKTHELHSWTLQKSLLWILGIAWHGHGITNVLDILGALGALQLRGSSGSRMSMSLSLGLDRPWGLCCGCVGLWPSKTLNVCASLRFPCLREVYTSHISGQSMQVAFATRVPSDVNPFASSYSASTAAGKIAPSASHCACKCSPGSCQAQCFLNDTEYSVLFPLNSCPPTYCRSWHELRDCEAPSLLDPKRGSRLRAGRSMESLEGLSHLKCL